MELGQIHPQTPLGQAICKLLMSDVSIERVVDVGCWNGLGTTLCVMEAMKARKKGLSCIAIESNKEMWQKAVQAWQFKVGPETLKILYGRFGTSVMSRQEIQTHPLFGKIKNHYDLWYEVDLKDYAACQTIEIQGSVDLVILDGGEFCGKGDLEAALKLTPRYIVLDDVEVMKNCENAIRLGKMGWEMIFATRDRNGSVIFKAKKM
jgi:hypothetical protein